MRLLNWLYRNHSATLPGWMWLLFGLAVLAEVIRAVEDVVRALF